MCIGGDEGQEAVSHFHQHTGHDGTNLVHARGEDGLLKALSQYICGNLPYRSIGHGRQLRELITLMPRQFIAAFTGNQFDGKCVVIDRNRNRHIREVLHDFQEQTGGNGHFASALHHVRNKTDRHGHIEVRGGDLQLVLIQMEEEVIQDGQGVL